MGTEVHYKSYLPGYYSMRDLNEDSSSNSWPLFYGDKTVTNGQHFNGFLSETVSNIRPGYDKNALKQTMLEHEAIFKHQVSELHRLYRTQRDMMDDFRGKELHKHRIPLEMSSSSSPLASRMPREDARKWHKFSFSYGNTTFAGPSVSGAEVISSPPIFSKQNSTQAGPFLSQNRHSSEDCEILESRPSKVRKKLFDLQLPADEYIDSEEGEHSPGNKMSDNLSYATIRNLKVTSECGVKLNLGGGIRVGRKSDASKSGSCLRGSVELADLNEPIQVGEVTIPGSVDFMGRPACHGQDKFLGLSAKPESPFALGLPKGNFLNCQYGNYTRSSSSHCLENKENGRDWLPYMHEAGQNKTHLNPISQSLQPDKSSLSSQMTHTSHEKATQSSGILPSAHRSCLFGESTVHGLEPLERRHDLFIDRRELVAASNAPNPLVHSEMGNGWSHSISSWGMSSGNLMQKLTPVQPYPSLHSSNNPQSSAQSHEIFGDCWHHSNGSTSRSGFSHAFPDRNGFFHGSPSGSKDTPACFPSVGIDYPNFRKDDNMASEQSIDHGPGVDLVDMKLAKDMNLNVSLPKHSYSDVLHQRGSQSIDEGKKRDVQLEGLPWLKVKPDNKFRKNETVEDINQDGTRKNNQAVESWGHGKILGFPIFCYPHTSKNESSSLVSASENPQANDLRKEGKAVVIDINVACDPESEIQTAEVVLSLENERDEKDVNLRTHIDLNSCVTDEELPPVPLVSSGNSLVKKVVEIDLEAPPVPEEAEEDILAQNEQQQCEKSLPSPEPITVKHQDEEIRIAADAIVAISSSAHSSHVEKTSCPLPEHSMEDPLLWFVDVISSPTSNFDNKTGPESEGKDVRDNELSSSEEIDYFELMTLNLPEVKEEEYMPKPLAPENWEADEAGAVSLPNRTRRGLGRRGRQRRDFQRDILPGLTSLSRHEVTEDLQTFGGLMRATGHPWQSGPTRRNGARNGAGRGRRRSVVDPVPSVTVSTDCTQLIQQLSCIEAALEDRSLTVWGKTPRRPRRQRCPAGNPPTILLA